MQLKRVIAEALNESDMPIEEFIEHVENLKGEYFEGSMKSGKAEIDDSNLPKEIYADFVSSFDNFKEDGFSVEDLIEFTNFIRNREPLKGIGYTFGDYIHQDMSDEEIEENYPDETGRYWLFLNLDINPSEFDGDFEKLAKDLDAYVLGYKEKYDEIKARVSDDQKKSVKKLTKRVAGIKKAIPVIFTNGVVTEKEQTEYHSHATFSSNSTSHGLYVVEYPNIIKGQKGLTKEDIENYMYLIFNNIQIPVPKGSLYSTMTGATKEFVMDKLKNGDYELDGNVIRLRDLPYTDLFIGD